MAGRLGKGTTRTALEPLVATAGRPRGSRALRKALAPTEDELHRSVAEFLDWTLAPRVFWTTFPAGWGRLSKGLSGRLQASGLKPGVPDILILAGRPYFIELKIPGNKPTVAQQICHAQIERAGGTVMVCTSLEEVDAFLETWKIPRRASLTLANSSPKKGFPKELEESSPEA